MNNQRIQITNHSDRTVTWTLERPDGRANVIDQVFLDEMSHALDELETDKLVTALLIRSGHPKIFLAGADLTTLTKLGPDELENLLHYGQDTFTRLSRLDLTTVCAINGPCLGGGGAVTGGRSAGKRAPSDGPDRKAQSARDRSSPPPSARKTQRRSRRRHAPRGLGRSFSRQRTGANTRQRRVNPILGGDSRHGHSRGHD